MALTGECGRGAARARFESAMRRAKAALRFAQMNAFAALALLTRALGAAPALAAFGRLAGKHALLAPAELGRLMAKLDATAPSPSIATNAEEAELALSATVVAPHEPLAAEWYLALRDAYADLAAAAGGDKVTILFCPIYVWPLVSLIFLLLVYLYLSFFFVLFVNTAIIALSHCSFTRWTRTVGARPAEQNGAARAASAVGRGSVATPFARARSAAARERARCWPLAGSGRTQPARHAGNGAAARRKAATGRQQQRARGRAPRVDEPAAHSHAVELAAQLQCCRIDVGGLAPVREPRVADRRRGAHVAADSAQAHVRALAAHCGRYAQALVRTSARQVAVASCCSGRAGRIAAAPPFAIAVGGACALAHAPPHDVAFAASFVAVARAFARLAHCAGAVGAASSRRRAETTDIGRLASPALAVGAEALVAVGAQALVAFGAQALVAGRANACVAVGCAALAWLGGTGADRHAVARGQAARLAAAEATRWARRRS